MKHILIYILFLCVINTVQGQTEYFGQRFNYDYAPVQPTFRNERCNGGIRTQFNYLNTPDDHFFTSVGTSFRDIIPGLPPTGSDRIRFIRLDKTGAAIDNYGIIFPAINGSYFNSSANSLAEVDNKNGTGGYVAVGAVTDNPATGASAAGGSDILITWLNSSGGVLNAIRIDLDNGRDEALHIRKSAFINGNPSFIICGISQQNLNFTDCFVARIVVSPANISIQWLKRFNFDPTGPANYNSAHCKAYQLSEDSTGNIFVVGTLTDNQGTNGTDGLAFALNKNGGVLWSKNYHAGSDDAFRAIQYTSSGNLIIGGYTNSGAIAPATHNTMILQLDITGIIQFQNIVEARDAGLGRLTSKCYDIVEASPTGSINYYLGGIINRNNTYVSMMHRTDKSGIGIEWIEYNTMLFNEGISLSYDPSKCAGITMFSSMQNIEDPNYSDSHIQKTDKWGKSCNHNIRSAESITLNLQQQNRTGRASLGHSVIPLGSATSYYENKWICKQICSTGLAAKLKASPVIPEMLNNQSLLSPDIKSPGLKIYPSPAINNLYLQFSSIPAGEYKISLTNMEGKIMQKSTMIITRNTVTSNINIAHLPPGVYIISASNGNLLLKQRVIKQ